MSLAIAPDLRAAIATTYRPAATMLATSNGKPFTDAGFGNWLRDQCNAARLNHCTSPSLRKAAMRRLAESGASQQELKAVSGHSGDDEVATYTRRANQQAMAKAAIERVLPGTRLTTALP